MPRKVTVNPGFSNVQLPNGLFYNGGDVVVLTDEQGSKLLDTVFTKQVVASDGVSRAVLYDNGPYGVPGSGVAATSVTGVTGITATGVGAYSGGTAGYNSATQATAIVTAVNALVQDVTNIRTVLNAEIAALKVANLQVSP